MNALSSSLDRRFDSLRPGIRIHADEMRWPDRPEFLARQWTGNGQYEDLRAKSWLKAERALRLERALFERLEQSEGWRASSTSEQRWQNSSDGLMGLISASHRRSTRYLRRTAFLSRAAMPDASAESTTNPFRSWHSTGIQSSYRTYGGRLTRPTSRCGCTRVASSLSGAKTIRRLPSVAAAIIRRKKVVEQTWQSVSALLIAPVRRHWLEGPRAMSQHGRLLPASLRRAEIHPLRRLRGRAGWSADTQRQTARPLP